VYGLMPDASYKEIRHWLDQLAAQGFVQIGEEYRTFSLTPRGRELLRGEQAAILTAVAPGARRPAVPRSAESRGRKPEPAAVTAAVQIDDDDDIDVELFEKLRALRKELADARHLAAFHVFSNRTLEAIARAKPTSGGAFLAVSGVGPKKHAQYGERFIDCVRRHLGA
jgi:ATP-dependent DNA helicase RecQ